MSELRVFSGDDRQAAWHTHDPDSIQDHLQGLGVVFSQPCLSGDIPHADASQDEVIESERELVDELMRKHGFETIDVLSVTPEYPRIEKLQQDFQNEHLHPAMEARLFLAGRGCFFLRDKDAVYAVVCERGDFISVPANLSHWFDMGESPLLCMVRLYTRASDWQAIPSGGNRRGEYPGPAPAPELYPV